MKPKTLVSCIAAAIAIGGPALADPAANALKHRCAETFAERLMLTRRALLEYPAIVRAYTRDQERVMPWFDAHCRLLEQSEHEHPVKAGTVAFVCDTEKGRPRELSGTFVYGHTGPPPSIFGVQKHANDNSQCASTDPVSLDLYGMPDDASGGPSRLLDDLQRQASLNPKDAVAHDHELFPRATRMKELVHELDILCFGITSKACTEFRIVRADRVVRMREYERLWDALRGVPASAASIQETPGT